MSRIHLSLATTDLEASTRFYTALLGTPPDKVQEAYRRFAPADHPIVLSLHPGTPATTAGHEHLGLRFADVAATKAAWARTTAAGLDVHTEGEVSCCWAVQQKAWAHDPDGRPWELYTVLEDLPTAGDTRCCA
jgi:catechol 2,3-dioxygenase-like lactoylglutathione lyase family enzyme